MKKNQIELIKPPKQLEALYIAKELFHENNYSSWCLETILRAALHITKGVEKEMYVRASDYIAFYNKENAELVSHCNNYSFELIDKVHEEKFLNWMIEETEKYCNVYADADKFPIEGYCVTKDTYRQPHICKECEFCVFIDFDNVYCK